MNVQSARYTIFLADDHDMLRYEQTNLTIQWKIGW